MNTSEILSIVSLIILGICLIVGIVKEYSKNSQKYETISNVLVFIAVVLLGISQLLQEDNFELIESTTPVKKGIMGCDTTNCDPGDLGCCDQPPACPYEDSWGFYSTNTSESENQTFCPTVNVLSYLQFENQNSGMCKSAGKSEVSAWNPVSGRSDLYNSSDGKIYGCKEDGICSPETTKSLPPDVKPCCGKDKPITADCCNCDVTSLDYMKGCY